MTKHEHEWRWQKRNNGKELWDVCTICGKEKELKIIGIEPLKGGSGLATKMGWKQKCQHIWQWQRKNKTNGVHEICQKCGTEQQVKSVSEKCRERHHKWHWPIDETKRDGFIHFDRICERCGKVEHLKISLEDAKIIHDFIFGT